MKEREREREREGEEEKKDVENKRWKVCDTRRRKKHKTIVSGDHT